MLGLTLTHARVFSTMFAAIVYGKFGAQSAKDILTQEDSPSMSCPGDHSSRPRSLPAISVGIPSCASVSPAVGQFPDRILGRQLQRGKPTSNHPAQPRPAVAVCHHVIRRGPQATAPLTGGIRR